MYTPGVEQMNTEIRVMNRTETTVNGSPKISYAPASIEYDLCSWKGRGGTETVHTGTIVVEDTAEVKMWFRADISEKDRLIMGGKAYDVLNVENVEQRGIFLILKVKRAVNA